MANKNEKMVMVCGMLVPESKVEGRLMALAHGREINQAMNNSLRETRRNEVRQLREDGWKEDEITQKFLQENAEFSASHGFIRPARVYRAPKRNYGNGLMFH